MTDRAHIERDRWCVYPCQKIGPDGQKIKRDCRVNIDPRYSGKVWQLTGTTDAPTLSPSIDCEDRPCWHGFIIDGEVRP